MLFVALPLQPSILPVLILIITRVSLFLFLFVFRFILISLTFELPHIRAFTFHGVRSLDLVVSERWRAC